MWEVDKLDISEFPEMADGFRGILTKIFYSIMLQFYDISLVLAKSWCKLTVD